MSKSGAQRRAQKLNPPRLSAARLKELMEKNQAVLKRLQQQETEDFRPFLLFNAESNAIYVYLVPLDEHWVERTTTAVADSVMFDWNAAGKLIGIEVLLPREHGPDAAVCPQEPGGPVPSAQEPQDLPVPGD